MITWHPDEPVDVAALQFSNVIFSVPQLSVRLNTLPKHHLQMIEFYTNYCVKNRSILLHGDFVPYAPLSNYPILSASDEENVIFGVYEDHLVYVDSGFEKIDLVNGKLSEQIVFELDYDLGKCKVVIYDCMGYVDYKEKIKFKAGIHSLEVPPNGIIQIRKRKR